VPQERDLVFDLLPVFGGWRATAVTLRPIQARRFCDICVRKVGSLGMCLHFSQSPQLNREKCSCSSA
jgi:hypothetical protein